MNQKKPYSAPDIISEDMMEQTALQTCWVTEAYDGNNGFGNFVETECANPVEKAPGFSGLGGCESQWPESEDNKNAEPFS